MADLVITAGSVLKGSGATTVTGTAGAAITAGQLLYMDTADSNKMKLADANGGGELEVVRGVALHAAAAGQPITYQTAGQITIGATVTVGETYISSDTAGGIRPIADLDAADRVAYVGYAISTTVLQLNIINTGVDRA